MMMMAGRLRTIMVTRHIPVSAVGRTITPKGIVEAACLGDQFLKKYEGIDAPRIGICALNPHAGEAGLIGREEVTVIRPAIVKLRQMRINCEGPLPADSAWQRHAAGEFDMLITMYHDQAMIPLKCIAPDKIVNITAGLPFIRTSPGHGTAFNIAGKNKADPRPMIEAILCAARFSQARLARQ
jgi:4-hydroxythreonine-4-phosphate dehydrogenase